jgi:LysR family transcriptional regulator, flagellar master operon regulator
MVSSDVTTRADLTVDRYILTHYADAFATAHRQLLPEMGQAQLSVGQSATAESLLLAMGGSAYVLADAAQRLEDTGRFHVVTDAPLLTQPVYAAMHLRNRISKTHRRMTRIAGRVFARRSTSPSEADSPEHGPDEPA